MLLKAFAIFRQLQKNRFLDSEAIEKTQIQKLKPLLQHACSTVPYYRDLFEQNGLKPEDIQSPGDLAELPITDKEVFRNAPLEYITSSKFDLQRLECEHTSGSTGQPISIFFDDHYNVIRRMLFLRALYSCGYRIGKKILLITDTRHKKGGKGVPGWHYASILNSSEELLKDLNRIRPEILYGCSSTLRLLAEHIRSRPGPVHQPKAVVSTAETLERKTRHLLKTVFKAELFDFYGLTEMGMAGWECSRHAGYHLSQDTTIFEFVPIDELPGTYRAVMTNLHLYAMPFIRFETGDIVCLGENNGDCACGCRFPMIERVEGRTAHIIRLDNGKSVSPYHLTCRIEEIPALKNYQVIQKKNREFLIRVEIDQLDRSTKAQIRNSIKGVLGEDAVVQIQQEKGGLIRKGEKFQVVKSEMGGAL